MNADMSTRTGTTPPSRCPRIAVIGDIFTDEYVIGSITRHAPEGGQPIFAARETISVPGGAGNTARQLTHFDCDVQLFGSFAGTKRRLIADGNYFLRHDIDEPAKPLESFDPLGFDAVVLSDYDKGTFGSNNLFHIQIACGKRGIPIVCDGKAKRCDEYSFSETSVLKVNDKYPSPRGRRCIVTRGAAGPIVDGEPIPTKPSVNVVSVVGAGDCFAAALAYYLAIDTPYRRAAELAYSAGRCYVQHPYNRPVHPLEVLRDCLPLGKRVDAESLRGLFDTRTPSRVVVANGCFDLLHPGHVHTLQWAKTQGDVLVAVVNDDDSVRRIKGPGRPNLSLADRVAMLAALPCVDWIVTFDGDTPESALRVLRPDVLVKGHEFAGRESTVPCPAGCVVRVAPASPFTLHTSDLIGSVAAHTCAAR